MGNPVVAALFLRYYEREVAPGKKEKGAVRASYFENKQTMKRNAGSYKKAFEKLVEECRRTLN